VTFNPHSRDIRSYNISKIDPESWTVAQKQQRAHEDRYQAVRINIFNNDSLISTFRYFAVFDGHGGSGKMDLSHVGDYCSKYLHMEIAKELSSIDPDDNQLVAHTIRQTFVDFDMKLRINNEYGTTCTAVIIDDTRSIIYQINLGDSRSIIFNTDTIISVTEDHDPTIKSEKSRIEAAGGVVYGGRIDGILMISRAFGDFDFKITDTIDYDPINGKVSAVPDIKIVSIKRPMHIVLTSDAPFERNAFSNESLVALFKTISNTNKNTAEIMVSTIAPKTTDDTTIILVSV
jgi:serine/threonine protein phosphatase PrpC